MTETPENAEQIHLYSYHDVLRPRGGILQKESLSAYLLERLEDAYANWTDPKYADNPTEADLVMMLQKNVTEEIIHAMTKFRENHGMVV